jgi:uncharacterized membrane protein
MLGWCMVIMAALVRLSPLSVGVIGIFIIFFQQIFQYFPDIFPVSIRPAFGQFWAFIYPSELKAFPGISILYVIVPWIGVMAAGYGVGKVFLLQPEKRLKICLWLGLCATAVFIVLAVINAARSDEQTVPFIMRVLNQKKYPASQIFLLMTLGPLIACIPLAEKAKGWLSGVFIVFGKVPLFYYVLHILFIHAGALAINYFREGTITTTRFAYAPFVEVEPGQRWSLGLLYAEFFFVVFILYFFCKWYANVKKDHPEIRWLRYL